jgi:hypothetical protein
VLDRFENAGEVAMGKDESPAKEQLFSNFCREFGKWFYAEFFDELFIIHFA